VPGHEFLINWDDQMIYDNTRLTALTWENVRWMFTDASYHPRHIYMPLAWLWWSAVHELFGLSAPVLHRISVALHALNGVFVFLLLRQLSRRIAPDSGSCPSALPLGIAGLGAMVWVLHPLRVEPVAWAITQKFLIATALALAAVALWLRWIDHRNAGATAPGSYAGAFLCYLSSLLFYPLALPLPGVLFLVYLALRRPAGPVGRWADRLAPAFGAVAPHLIAGCAVMIPALTLTYSGPNLDITAADPRLTAWPARLMEAAYVWVHFLWKPLVLDSYAPVYTILLEIDRLSPPFVASALAVLAISLAAFLLRRRAPWLGVLWLCHLALLVPMLGIGIRTPNFPNDRYSYLQGICGAVLIVGLLARCPWKRWPPYAWKLALLPALALVVWLGGLTAAQTKVWRDNTAFFEHALRKLEGDDYSWVLQKRLAYTHLKAGRLAEGREALLRAARGKLTDYGSLANFVKNFEQLRDFAAAADAATRAACLHPSFEAYVVMARTSLNVGRKTAAVSALQRALRYRTDGGLYVQLARLLSEQGRLAEARLACEEGLRQPLEARQHEQLRRLAADAGRAIDRTRPSANR